LPEIPAVASLRPPGGRLRQGINRVTISGTTAEALREAARLERLGKLPEAMATYERLLTRWPHLSEGWYNLGLLQRRARQFEAALASYARALEQGIAQPEEVHLNRGVIFSDCLRQDEAAERELHAALALNPGYLPALQNLANLHEDLGRREEARGTYARMLELDPNAFEALARYAQLADVQGPSDPLIARLRLALAHPAATSAGRASLGFALARALDACAEYREAFAAAEAANRASRASAPAVRYDRAAHEAFIDELIRAFQRPRPRAHQARMPAGPRPIFICGMFRSGSTLTEQLLAGSAQLTRGGELDFLPQLVHNELAPFPASMTAVPQATLDHLAAQYRASLARLFPGAACVTDKRPDNFLYLGLIHSLFPDARIVHTSRDPLDTCLSIFFLHLDPRVSYALDLMDIGHYFRQYHRLMAHWKALYGEDILDFNYDALVREPRPAAQRLFTFCGLDWDEACLDLHGAGAVKTASVWQVREGLYQRSSGRSRHYARELAPLAAYFADLEKR
jgi:tetratricopeptide (TPR) repeat protein